MQRDRPTVAAGVFHRWRPCPPSPQIYCPHSPPLLQNLNRDCPIFRCLFTSSFQFTASVKSFKAFCIDVIYIEALRRVDAWWIGIGRILYDQVGTGQHPSSPTQTWVQIRIWIWKYSRSREIGRSGIWSASVDTKFGTWSAWNCESRCQIWLWKDNRFWQIFNCIWNGKFGKTGSDLFLRSTNLYLYPYRRSAPSSSPHIWFHRSLGGRGVLDLLVRCQLRHHEARATVRVRDRFLGRNDGRAKWAGRRRLWFGNAGQEQEARRKVGRGCMVSLTMFNSIFLWNLQSVMCLESELIDENGYGWFLPRAMNSSLLTFLKLIVSYHSYRANKRFGEGARIFPSIVTSFKEMGVKSRVRAKNIKIILMFFE